MKHNPRNTKRNSKEKREKRSTKGGVKKGRAVDTHRGKREAKRKSVGAQSYSALETYDTWLSKQKAPKETTLSVTAEQKPEEQSFLSLETTDKWLETQRPRAETPAEVPEKARTEGAVVVGSFDQWVVRQVAEKEKEAAQQDSTETTVTDAEASGSEASLPPVQQSEGLSA